MPPSRNLDTSTRSSSYFGGRPWIARLCLILATVACYYDSVLGTFLWDDRPTILFNPQVRSLWDAERLSSMRGLVDFSFAANVALGGLAPWGFHIINIAVHLLAGLILFGLARRMLTMPSISPVFRSRAQPLAFVIALIWLVHPLNTEAVTYICQRYEAVASLCYLFAMYAFMRGAQDSERRSAWFGGVLLAFAAGLRSKEIIVTLPFMLPWIDCIFVAPYENRPEPSSELPARTIARSPIPTALRQVWRCLTARGWLYAGLTVVAVVMAGPAIGPAACSVAKQVFVGTASPSGTSDGRETTVVLVDGTGPLDYLASQPAAGLHYLTLIIWPTDQCLDAGWVARPTPEQRTLGLAMAIGVMALLIGWAWQFPRTGFLAGSAMLVLAPTSSIVPLSDAMAEHRMYLALAPLTALAVLTAASALNTLHARWPRLLSDAVWPLLGPLLVAVALVGLSTLTIVRNLYYRSGCMMWALVCQQHPEFWRPHVNLSQSLLEERRDIAAAERELSMAVDLNPGRADLYRQRGVLRDAMHHSSEALADFELAIRLDPQDANTFFNRAVLNFKLHQLEQAAEDCRRALELNPTNRGAQQLLVDVQKQEAASASPH